MSTFTPYQQQLKLKERVDQILASDSPEELQKVLKPYSLEERIELLDKSMDQCIRIIDYYSNEKNDNKFFRYLTLESFLFDLEVKYRELLCEVS